jgi:hypothetical protein
MSSTPCTSLAAATAHAVDFLTRPLLAAYPLQTVAVLRTALTGTLLAHYGASWDERNPALGARRRILTLAPGGAPPRPVHAAAQTAGVAWARWSAALGGAEFDLLVSPGAVRVRTPAGTLAIWDATELQASEDALKASIRATLCSTLRAGTRARTFPALALETANLPAPARAPSPASSVSSDRSSLFSAVSAASTASSIFSPVAPKPTLHAAPKPAAKATPFQMSRRERARQRRAGVTIAPPAVPTEYDGGKTTVLGGGIRLGPAREIACA